MFGSVYDARMRDQENLRSASFDAASLGGYKTMAAIAGEAGGMLGQGIGQAFGALQPEEAKQAKINEMMGQFPNPTTYEDYMTLAGEFNSEGILDVGKYFHELAQDMKTTKTAARKTLTGDDGLKYYLDTGERVFPGQTSKPSTEGIKIPEGYQLTEENGALRMTPIPGSPAEAKLKGVDLSKKAKNQGVVRSSKLVDNTIERLKKVIDVAKNNDVDNVFGITGAAGQYIPSSARNNAESLSETIKSHIGFDRLDRMRQESPTGGALGQVSEMELRQLNATLGSLAFSQSREQFLITLDQIKSEYGYIMQKIQDTGDGTFTQGKPKKDPLNIGL